MANFIRSRNGAKAAKVPPVGKVYRYWMRDRPGLCLKVTPSGQKCWVFQYREVASEKPYEERKTRKLRLPPECRYFEDTEEHWDEVRDTAALWRRWLEHGHDPQQVIDDMVTESLPAAPVDVPRRAEMTFGRLVEIYLRLRRGYLSSSAYKRAERLAKRHVFEKPVGEVPVSEVTQRDLETAVASEKSDENAKALATLLAQVSHLAFQKRLGPLSVESRALIPQDLNARTRSRKIELAKAEEDSGARHLENEEVRAIWNCDAAYPAKPWWMLMLLTGMRKSEAAGIEWDEVEGGYINVPARKAKNGEAYKIPLTPQIRGLLDEIGFGDPTLRASGRWLFASPKNPRLSIDVTSNYWSGKVLKAAGIEGASPHSARKTSTTGMASLGLDEVSIELAHNRAASKLSKSIKKAYYRNDKQPLIDAAIEAWGAQVEKIVGGNVKKLRRAG